MELNISFVSVLVIYTPESNFPFHTLSLDVTPNTSIMTTKYIIKGFLEKVPPTVLLSFVDWYYSLDCLSDPLN
jgi:hypothetical protein